MLLIDRFGSRIPRVFTRSRQSRGQACAGERNTVIPASEPDNVAAQTRKILHTGSNLINAQIQRGLTGWILFFFGPRIKSGVTKECNSREESGQCCGLISENHAPRSERFRHVDQSLVFGAFETRIERSFFIQERTVNEQVGERKQF